ncbi:MAG: methyltransferase domain-containing protein [Verrucomicrobia bacterium]|nr:methyltransferase domain-containing protein [Verrucomicrobiota bacterium]
MDTHKAWVQTTFDKGASGYGEKGCGYFAYFGKKLVDLASPQPGDAILDVACGRGAVLFPAAQAVGEKGKAVGIDISSQMIEEAKKESPFSWIQLQQMDAEELQFQPEAFDVVFSGFCLFFLPNVQKALSEFKRVLKPSGKIAVSVWGDRSELDSWFHAKIH